MSGIEIEGRVVEVATPGMDSRQVALFVTEDGIIEAMTSEGEPELGRFAVGTNLRAFFDATSQDVLRASMERAMEESRLATCWPVLSVPGAPPEVYYAEVACLGGLGGRRKFAVSLLSGAHERARHEAAASAADCERCVVAEKRSRTLAHDINNHLTTILSFAGFLAEDIDEGDPRRADVVEIVDAATEASRLSEGFLDRKRE